MCIGRSSLDSQTDNTSEGPSYVSRLNYPKQVINDIKRIAIDPIKKWIKNETVHLIKAKEGKDTKLAKVKIPRIVKVSVRKPRIVKTESEWKLKSKKMIEDKKDLVIKSASILYDRHRSLSDHLGGSTTDFFSHSFYGLFRSESKMNPRVTYLKITSPK